MDILGIEEYEFGVENLAKCEQFICDFGLTPVPCAPGSEGAICFEALNGSRVSLYPIDDARLPPAFENGSTMRRVTWGLASADALNRLAEELADVPGFVRDETSLTCRDPNGMTLRFRVSALRDVTLDVVPINQWGDARRVDQPSPVYDKATPIGIGHAVFFVEELDKVEQFYREKLGFHVSDRYVGKGVFLRTAARAGHHNLFLLHVPGKPRGLNHVAFTVRDIHEVFGGGLAMSRAGWATFLGPGRHPISSAYFWYVKSPAGGAFEFYTNEDHLTEAWAPRELQHSVESFTEWAVEGGIDAATRRQVRA
ncbi:VOC family protein [Dyella caseinilytica]|uniref:VOC family protein n=1 Tax=Dyella caseinilytica TaxID=1849581 RepID=A0ABX7GRW7_9GAMM|nr:VOC family protein [Dyella caseinilytica]QRN53170.1 VOC family protein [Dyella caseinilytica]GGA12002.1 glyoxalase [Dyella caseinilytica]